MAVNKILCKPPTSGKIEITDDGGFKLWQEKTTASYQIIFNSNSTKFCVSIAILALF